MQHKKNAASQRHRERNPGYYRRYNGSQSRIAWLEANKERRRTYARAYQSQDPDRAEKGRRWREANRTYLQVRERNRRAQKTNNPGSATITSRDWLRLCRRHHGRCAYCARKPAGTLEMDHVIPLSKGGRHAIGNILPACRACNSEKSAAYYIVWKYRRAYRLMAKLYGGEVGWASTPAPA